MEGKQRGENKMSTLTKPVKLQNVADFESLVKKHFPHVNWKMYPNNKVPSATYLVDGGIVIEATRKYIGKGNKSELIGEWSIDCSPGGTGRTIDECVDNFRNRVKATIANIYEPGVHEVDDFEKAKASGERILKNRRNPAESFGWVLWLTQMELGKDIPVPVDPYADLRKD